MKKAKEKRVCPQCKKRFRPKRPHAVYDAEKCRKAAFAERRAEQLRIAKKIIEQQQKGAA